MVAPLVCALAACGVSLLLTSTSAVAEPSLASLLTAHPWCLEQTTPSASAPARNTSQERVQFRADGSVSLNLGSNATLSMGGMSMSSMSWRSESYRWRLEPGLLWLSRDGGQQWTSGTLSLNQSENSLVLSIDGSEYRPCR